MKICAQCVLPESFPTIEFDTQGVCNYCRSFQGKAHHDELKRKYRERFEELIETHRGKGDYDILIAYSGGKDSTYTLDLFKNYFQLRVLALTFDHGFVSPCATENIKRVIEKLGIDHLYFKPNIEVMKKIFVLSINGCLYPKKSLERASPICTSCMSLVKFISLRMAIEKRIPFIGYGWSPGQAPIQSSVMKTSPSFIQSTQRLIYNPLYEKMGDAINPYFLRDSHFELKDRFPYDIHPLAFLEYNEEKIYHRIRQLGWIPPKDTDPNSTNCLMNAFANQVHISQFGFHPYAFEIAGLVRMGILSREEGLKRLNEPNNPQVIDEIKQKLGL